MHFKYPEILYALFLLVIPILVHLFQLRRFKKQFFTNVRFLKALSIQTRKSSKLKKWLLLATRLLMLAAAVFAFAQPFFAAKDKEHSNNELFIILDNSYSMQAKGQQGELLRRAVEDLLEHTPENQQFSLLTADQAFWNTDIKSVRQDLQNLDYSATPFNIDALMAKVTARKSVLNKDVVVITDAVGQEKAVKKPTDGINGFASIPKAEQKQNVAIDSVYLKQTLDNFYEIGASLSASGNPEAVSVSIFDDGKLIAKTQTSFDTEKKELRFTIPRQDFNGYMSISDKGLEYDNTYFFSITKPKQASVLSIGDGVSAAFLSRIYTSPEFSYTDFSLRSVDYNQIDNQDVIILNELKDVPQALQTTLKSFVEKGGNLVVIPSAQTNLQSLNNLLSQFGAMKMSPIHESKKQVTQIVFNHPLYQRVFEKKIDNFQYPETRSSFSIATNAQSALAYEDRTPFLASLQNKGGTVYVFASPLNKDNGNFQNAPLIVPTFYNMAQNAANAGVTAFTIGNSAPVVIEAQLGTDDIVNITSKDESFIPGQQLMGRKVRLDFGDSPAHAGNYALTLKNQALQNISFNYSRSESNLQSNADAYDSFVTVATIESLFNDLHTARTDTGIWKWFVILALLALVAEILIQKFVK